MAVFSKGTVHTSANKVTGYSIDDRSSIYSSGKDLSLCSCVHTSSEPPIPKMSGIWDSFNENKSGLSVKQTTHLSLVARLRM
jgi:hypothetical protein